MPPSASVVIPVRNGAKTIADQLDALAGQDLMTGWNLIVADNGCTDDTVQIVLDHRLSSLVDVTIVDASIRPGINVARNAGVVESAAPIIAFCDADDAVDQAWIRSHLEAHVRSHAGVIGGPLRVTEINPPSALRWSVGFEAQPLIDQHLPYVVGANFSITRGAWDATGGFNEAIRLGWDEVDFCIRARQRGIHIDWCDAAIVDYRLRDGAWINFKQRVKYGRGESYCRRQHADSIAPLPPLGVYWAKRLIVRLLRLATTSPKSSVWPRRLLRLAADIGIVSAMLDERRRSTSRPVTS